MNLKVNKKMAILVVAILILVGGVGVISYYVINGSTNLFKVIINKTFNALEDNVVDSDSVENTLSLRVSGSSDDSATNDILEMFSKINLSLVSDVDYKNKIISTSLRSKYNDDKLLNGNIYTEKGEVYCYFADFYDKYIMFDIEDYDKLFNAGSSPDDTKLILTKLNKYLNKSLRNKYFEKGKKDGYKYIKLKLTKENYKEIRKSLIDALREDNVFLRSMSVVMGENIEGVNEYLDDILKQEVIDDMEVTIYTKGIISKISKLEVASSNLEVSVIPDGDKYKYNVIRNSSAVNDGVIEIHKYNDGLKGKISLNDRNRNSNINLVFDNKTKKNVSVEKKDVSGAIKYEDINNLDRIRISANIMKNKNLIDVIKQISLYSIANYRSSGSDSGFSIPDEKIFAVS